MTSTVKRIKADFSVHGVAIFSRWYVCIHSFHLVSHIWFNLLALSTIFVAFFLHFVSFKIFLRVWLLLCCVGFHFCYCFDHNYYNCHSSNSGSISWYCINNWFCLMRCLLLFVSSLTLHIVFRSLVHCCLFCSQYACEWHLASIKIPYGIVLVNDCWSCVALCLG